MIISNPKDPGITLEANKGTSNPIRVKENMEAGKENLKGDRSPNLSGTRIVDAAIMERMVDWVKRRFGTSKEVHNVTLYHSCQKVPYQTFVDSPKSIGATKGDKSLWSDEVLELEDNSEATTSTRVEDQRETHNKNKQIN